MKNSGLSQLIKTNLNLLTSLYVLLKTKHITKASEQLFISQSALSQQLSRLRDIFDDNLLVRVNNEMVLTPVALQILPLVENAINSSNDVFNFKTDKIRPSKSHYSICMIDGSSMERVAELLLKVSNDYNNEVTFEIFNRYDECISDLNQGKLDFLIGSFDDLSNNIHQVKLANVNYAFYANKFHELTKFKDSISISEVNKYDLIEFKFHGRVSQSVEKYLDEYDNKKTVALTFSQYNSMIEVLRRSECVAILPNDMLDIKDLVKIEIKESLPEGNVYMYWHSLVDQDPFHTYLRHTFLNMKT